MLRVEYLQIWNSIVNECHPIKDKGVREVG